MARNFRAVAPYLLGVVILAGSAVFSLNSQSERWFQEAWRLEEEGRLEDAIERYEWAVRAYTPFSRNPSRALHRLQQIASEAERKDATQTAIWAWQAVVSSLSVVENVFQPHEEMLLEAENKLAALRHPASATSIPRTTPKPLESENRTNKEE